MTAAGPLVSILIPAYNERFFPQALESALAQTYPRTEIVVCDDSPGRGIGQAVERAASAKIRYVRNPARLGFAANFSQCFELAQGELIKFLNDDDRLRPRCVETLARVLTGNPGVMLATSRRGVIDAEGRECPDVPPTEPVSHVTALMLGRELGDFVLVNSLNLIGEPTTAMFRRAQLAVEDGAIFRWGGRDYHCLADLSLWLRLLATGLAYYDAGTLSEFRMHAGQEQEQGNMRITCLLERLWIAREARRAGFLSTAHLWGAVMRSLQARGDLSRRQAGLDAPTVSALDEFLADVNAELGALASS
jgi:glycosyltransferase involved in cell wall biosynthesis